MRPAVLTALLSAAFLLIAVYRYALIVALLFDHPGFLGMTIFTGLLFLPSVLAFFWRRELESRRAIGRAAVVSASIFMVLSLTRRPGMRLIQYAGNAFLLGLLEALLVPAVQGLFARDEESGAARGNSILWTASCAGLILSPVLAAGLPAAAVTVLGIVGVMLIAAVVRNATMEEEDAQLMIEAPRVHPAAGRRGELLMLFLTGVAVGAISNMIYPIAVRQLRLDGWSIGLYAALPMLAASCGAGIRHRLGESADRFLLPGFLLLPAALLFTKPGLLLPQLLGWSVCFGFVETHRLCGRKDLNTALSAKYGGIAGGIACSGLIAEAGFSPISVIAVSFYVALVLGGLLWTIL